MSEEILNGVALPMMRFFLLSLLLAPAIAYASTDGDASTTNMLLSAVSLAVQTYIASRIAPLEKRLKHVERELAIMKQAHGGIVE